MVAKYYRKVLILIGFLTGFIIIAIEISASRLSAPYFGTSIFVWSNIIAVVLFSLSIGYYFGGVLSEKHSEYRYLLRIILLAGVMFLFVPWVSNYLGELLQNASVSHTTSILYSLTFTFILFGLPLMLLAMVSPFILKLYTLRDAHVGNAAGILGAWSTIGSLLGTFVPTLWLIPTFGTRATLHILAVILVVIGSFSFSRKQSIFVAFLALSTFLFTSYPPVGSALASIYEKETAYSYLRVTEDADGTRYMQFDQGRGIQSAYNPKKVLTGYYYDYLASLLALVKEENKKVLVVGLAGGSAPRIMGQVFGESVMIDGVEIDEDVIDASKKYFGLNETNINFIHQDGRTYISQTSKKYDYIIVDVYQHESVIPWTLTTKEFWAEVGKRLSPNGIIAMNVLTDGKPELLTAITNTQASVFAETYVAKDEVGNFLLISSNNEIDFSLIEKKLDSTILKNTGEILVKSIDRVLFNSDGVVLTDDHAPIETLGS